VGGEVLLLDVGNSRLKCARPGPDGGLAHLAVLSLEPDPDGVRNTPSVWLEDQLRGCDSVLVSSSNPGCLQILECGVLQGIGVRRIGPGDLPLRVRSRGTGSDRVLAAYAAWKRGCGGVLVAGLGTAWTLDVVDPGGEFLGGAIGPGLRLQEEALARACPHLDPPAPGPSGPIPGSTETAVAAGTAGALAAALEALAGRFESAAGGEFRRYLTGGAAGRLRAWMSSEWESAPHLVLEGLARVSSEA